MAINYISRKDSDETRATHINNDNIEMMIDNETNDSIEIMIDNETNEIIKKSFESLLQRYQKGFLIVLI